MQVLCIHLQLLCMYYVCIMYVLLQVLCIHYLYTIYLLFPQNQFYPVQPPRASWASSKQLLAGDQLTHNFYIYLIYFQLFYSSIFIRSVTHTFGYMVIARSILAQNEVSAESKKVFQVSKDLRLSAGIKPGSGSNLVLSDMLCTVWNTYICF